MERVVLAYSGGLDTSAAIPWLAERGYEVVAVAVDVGQPGDLDEAVRRAREAGAVDALAVDARAGFVSGYVLPALRMNALYQGRYPLISALSRPLIAEVLVRVARDVGAGAVAHGCTGKGNDQVRFEVSLGALAPDLKVLAPVREWGMSRPETVAYARARGLEVESSKPSPYSIDENLWGRSIECGELEDPWTEPPEDAFALTAAVRDVSGGPRHVEVSFVGGEPSALDGETLDTANLIASLGKVAGSYGVGRIDMVEDRLVGIKSREVYEAPAAVSLIAAHADLESLACGADTLREKRRLEHVWADLVYTGRWFSPLRDALDAFAASTQTSVTGDVRLRFSPGSVAVAGRRSPAALYERSLATYDAGDSFDQSDAAGFVRLWGLPLKRWAEVHRGRG